MTWLENFIESLIDLILKKAPPVPSVTPLPVQGNTPVLDPLVNKVAALMLNVNNTWPYPPDGKWVGASGSSINKIDSATALSMAPIVVSAAKEFGVPLSWILAIIGSESMFDPKCDQPNHSYPGHTGSNTFTGAQELMGHDEGVCQLKIYVLMDDQKLTMDEAVAFAFDPAKAIPHMAKTMQGYLKDADQEIALIAGRSDVAPQFHNRYYMATGMYKIGPTGEAEYLASDKSLPQADQVVLREQSYSKALGLPSVFTDIAG